MTATSHIKLEGLIDLLQGRLGPGAWDRASKHLTTGCAECFADIAFLLRVMHSLRPGTRSLVSASLRSIPQGPLAPCAMPLQWVSRVQEGMTERVM
jgi:hypothetical protein